MGKWKLGGEAHSTLRNDDEDVEGHALTRVRNDDAELKNSNQARRQTRLKDLGCLAAHFDHRGLDRTNETRVWRRLTGSHVGENRA